MSFLLGSALSDLETDVAGSEENEEDESGNEIKVNTSSWHAGVSILSENLATGSWITLVVVIIAVVIVVIVVVVGVVVGAGVVIVIVVIVITITITAWNVRVAVVGVSIGVVI